MARHLIRSDQTLKAIRPGDPRKRINDGEGLYLLLYFNGGSHGWRFSYGFHGRRKLLSLGTYPKIGLALARQRAKEARDTLALGVDPSQKRKDNRTEFIDQRRKMLQAWADYLDKLRLKVDATPRTPKVEVAHLKRARRGGSPELPSH